MEQSKEHCYESDSIVNVKWSKYMYSLVWIQQKYAWKFMGWSVLWKLKDFILFFQQEHVFSYYSL